jgi:hypothetical protein
MPPAPASSRGGLKTPVEHRKTPQQGAATSVLAAASPLLHGIGGRYFEDCREVLPVRRRPTDLSGGVAPYAVDADNANRLWGVVAGPSERGMNRRAVRLIFADALRIGKDRIDTRNRRLRQIIARPGTVSLEALPL